jgi:hypothetical protein
MSPTSERRFMADSTSSMNVPQSARRRIRRQLYGALGERVLPAMTPVHMYRQLDIQGAALPRNRSFDCQRQTLLHRH